MISVVFADAIFLYITVILDEEFLRKTFTMNQTGPGVEKYRPASMILANWGFQVNNFPYPRPGYAVGEMR